MKSDDSMRSCRIAGACALGVLFAFTLLAASICALNAAPTPTPAPRPKRTSLSTTAPPTRGQIQRGRSGRNYQPQTIQSVPKKKHTRTPTPFHYYSKPPLSNRSQVAPKDLGTRRVPVGVFSERNSQAFDYGPTPTPTPTTAPGGSSPTSSGGGGKTGTTYYTWPVPTPTPTAPPGGTESAYSYGAYSPTPTPTAWQGTWTGDSTTPTPTAPHPDGWSQGSDGVWTYYSKGVAVTDWPTGYPPPADGWSVGPEGVWRYYYMGFGHSYLHSS